MYVRGQDGKWYEVDEKLVKGKEIDPTKVNQAMAEANAESRKKAAEVLATLDPEVVTALQDIVAVSISRGEFAGQVGAEVGLECWTAECWTAECIGMEMDTHVQPQMLRRSAQMPRRKAMMAQKFPQRIPQRRPQRVS